VAAWRNVWEDYSISVGKCNSRALKSVRTRLLAVLPSQMGMISVGRRKLFITRCFNAPADIKF
jgi:hypothetical protein